MIKLRPPDRIREIEAFGVGNFTDEELQDKCSIVHKLMNTHTNSHKPDVSIVVPAYKEKKYLIGTMRSIAEQTLADFEVIVVSNGEPYKNSTQQIAEQCGATVVHEPKAGFGLARQIGLETAQSNIIITTDADTLHDSKWAQGISDTMKDTEIKFGFGVIHSLSRNLLRRLFVETHNITRYLRSRLKIVRHGGLSEANSFLLRDAALGAGGYDKSCDFGEGMNLLKKIDPSLDATFLLKENTAAYTSGRKIDQMSMPQLFATSIRFGISNIRNKAMHLTKNEYPDIR